MSENISLKWKMQSRNHFTAERDGYIVFVNPFGGIYPYWSIMKDGVIIDEAPYRSPVTTDFNKELAVKAMAEKYLNKIINPLTS